MEKVRLGNPDIVRTVAKHSDEFLGKATTATANITGTTLDVAVKVGEAAGYGIAGTMAAAWVQAIKELSVQRQLEKLLVVLL